MPPARAPLFNSHHQHFHLFFSSTTIATSPFTLLYSELNKTATVQKPHAGGAIPLEVRTTKTESGSRETKTAPKHILPTALKFFVCQNNDKRLQQQKTAATAS